MYTYVTHVWMRGGKGVHLLGLEEFLRMEREIRALLIVEGKVEFLDQDGTAIPLSDALGQLRDSWIPSAA